jgi:hypothetical protein
MTKEQIIAVYALGQCARTALEKSGVGGSTEQRNNWWKAIGICDKMLAELGYPGHTQVLALVKDHWKHD